MGPIKINIKTSRIEESSEYGGYDNLTEANKEEEVKEVKEVEKAEKDETCYHYEGEECYYTEPASGTVFRWDKQSKTWINRDEVKTESENSSQVTPDYKMVDGTYVYVDKLTGQRHKWNLETNQWDKLDKADLSEEEDEEDSEEDENMTDEDRKARQYRKRKAAPGWDQSNYSKVITLSILQLLGWTD